MFFSEIAGSLYAWDLADEGVDRILDNLEEMTCCNSVYLVALMHHEKRPLTDYFYPHNPVRNVYYPEDSRAYWNPDPVFYGRIKPLTSERELLQGTDWLQMLIDAARDRGLKTGVEISHTVVDKERAAGDLSDVIQRNIFGERLGQLVCMNQPDIQEYVTGLFADLATNYDVEYIQTCLMPFNSGPRHAHPARRLLNVTLGGCFCEACDAAARMAGLDMDHVRDVLYGVADSLRDPTLAEAHENALLLGSNVSRSEILLQLPELYQWLAFRRDSMTRFFQMIHDRVHEIRDDIDLRLNAYISTDQELSGLDLRSLKPHLDSIRSSDYSEQSGDPARLEHKRQWLLAVRRAVGNEMPFYSAIGIRPKATPELIRQGVVISAECGVNGITMGHYDGASFTNLRAVKEGLERADVEMLDDWCD